MNNIGTQEIKTQRLLLRKIKKSDYRDIYKYASKEEVAKYVTWQPHKSIKETKALCRMWAEEYKKDNTYRWAIVYKDTVVGAIDVVGLINDSAFMGWSLDSLFWNKGIMTEAASAVRDYLFGRVGIDNIFASYITENIGSGRVMQKIGMTPVSSEEYRTACGEEIRLEVDGLSVSFRKISKAEWEKYQIIK